jgi:hypothetical protein
MDRLAAMRHADRERRRAQAGEPALEGPLPTVDSLASDLMGVQKLLDQVRARAGEGDLDEAKKGYLQALVRLRAIRELAAKRRPEMLPEIERVRDAAELAWDGAAQTAREARALFVQVAERMDRLDCEGVEETLQSLLSLRDRIDVERRPERDAIAEMASAVGTLAATCRTRRELAQARVHVTGILTGEKTTLESLAGIDGIRFVDAFAWAEINGQVYRAGDVIGGTRIRVDRITRGSVQVSLRGETREVGLRR